MVHLLQNDFNWMRLLLGQACLEGIYTLLNHIIHLFFILIANQLLNLFLVNNRGIFDDLVTSLCKSNNRISAAGEGGLFAFDYLARSFNNIFKVIKWLIHVS